MVLMALLQNITLANFDSVAYLGKLHTKQLLQVLKACRGCGGSYYPFDSDDEVTYLEVKNELTKREHIPNKQEARKIRQQKAKRR